MLQGLQQPFPKYLAPPGTAIPAEYMQVMPAYTQLIDIVQQHGCRIHRVTPHGNCLFRALSHQAFGDQIQMRAALVMQISNNLKKYQPFYIGRNLYHEHVASMYKEAFGVHNWNYKQQLIASDCQYMS